MTTTDSQTNPFQQTMTALMDSLTSLTEIENQLRAATVALANRPASEDKYDPEDRVYFAMGDLASMISSARMKCSLLHRAAAGPDHDMRKDRGELTEDEIDIAHI